MPRGWRLGFAPFGVHGTVPISQPRLFAFDAVREALSAPLGWKWCRCGQWHIFTEKQGTRVSLEVGMNQLGGPNLSRSRALKH